MDGRVEFALYPADRLEPLLLIGLPDRRNDQVVDVPQDAFAKGKGEAMALLVRGFLCFIELEFDTAAIYVFYTCAARGFAAESRAATVGSC